MQRKMEEFKFRLLYTKDLPRNNRRVCDINKKRNVFADVVIVLPNKPYNYGLYVNEETLLEAIVYGDKDFKLKLFNLLLDEFEPKPMPPFDGDLEGPELEYELDMRKVNEYSTDELKEFCKYFGIRISHNTGRERIIERLKEVR